MTTPYSPPHPHRPEPVPGSVVVGLSGSPAGRAALEFAANYAAEHGIALHCVRVWRDLDWFPSAGADAIPALIRAEHHGQDLLLNATTTLQSSHPGLALTGEFAPGDVYSVLQARSSDAALLVVGGSPAGDAQDDVKGPIGAWLSEHARCAVAVIDHAGRVINGAVPASP
jgi:nucleotide-binding universal stress UspA family protein